jgi:hypothetical protein
MSNPSNSSPELRAILKRLMEMDKAILRSGANYETVRRLYVIAELSLEALANELEKMEALERALKRAESISGSKNCLSAAAGSELG